MNRYHVIIVGAGPAGLSAAIEAARAGLNVVVFDENAKPGGQLFKQIHKFFGSKEHKAKIRGIQIGVELLKEAMEAGVRVELSSVVIGIYLNKEVVVQKGDSIVHYKGDSIIVATGASENMVTFEGWTLPGVIGAGAAQTMMNLHFVKPGKKILMLGSGNVGLVVSFQLIQAGCEVVAIVDGAGKVGGYGVHASKVARCGVPFYTGHTIIRADGSDHVESVTIGQVDANWNIIPGTQKHFEVDTICLAVGLSPMSQLLKMAGCDMEDTPGGYVPICDSRGETSIPGIFAAGDVSGIEEASSAMIEGRIAGIAAAAYLGFLAETEASHRITELESALLGLREGMFAPENRGKILTETQEGIPLSENLLRNGFVDEAEILRFPGMKKRVGVHPVMECTQNIPCNPCQDACPKNCITIGEKMVSLPSMNDDNDCTGCGMCVASCSGQAIFLINEEFDENHTSIMMPYEFYPLPKVGEKGSACDRSGKEVCEAEVISVRNAVAFDHTALLTIKVPSEYGPKARFYRQDKEVAI
ncbi:MAG: FAD-dependent oxidoreductase [Lachnospiraceae bacterium]